MKKEFCLNYTNNYNCKIKKVYFSDFWDQVMKILGISKDVFFRKLQIKKSTYYHNSTLIFDQNFDTINMSKIKWNIEQFNKLDEVFGTNLEIRKIKNNFNKKIENCFNNYQKITKGLISNNESDKKNI